ncbi:hypothetical protein F2P81_009437 [Scophthalmus maximus]|uniref:Ig-like domain-containing protein n=1 Tax=Scophthalmus maximus TaxID=52904 RepID=A0A6A4SYR0_SCOMX|nr:hypothetical protein F2P81_009437 [Scophthalmus maximus]
MDQCLLALVFGLLTLGGCSARVVTVSPGPLIRVEGQPVSIRCDVNEYSGPREQDFEWMTSREASGARMKIISTFDASYSHSSLSKRVASGDISVVRLEDNEVELKIAEAKALDAGLYWCQTPSTDSVISGNYEAQVQLIVIPNTLSVSPQTPPQEAAEGSDLTLSCNVTRALTQPTFLSVTWSLKSGATSEEILTLGPQGGVATGAKFARRYADGGIRLVPGKNGLFELVISRVTTSDGGTYECNGTEWTHENGGKWIKIVENTKEMGTVKVIPTGQSLAVRATSSASPSSTSLLLSPSDALTLLCSVTADNLQALALEVTWLAGDRDIVTMERSGIVISNTSSSLERTGAGEYRLGVRGVSAEDGGDYTCRVRAFIDKGGKSAGGGGRWHMAAEKRSGPVTVKVSQIMPSYTLTLEPALNPQMTAEPTELACHVTNVTHLPPGGRLGVTWEHTSLPGEAPQTSHHIGSLDGSGNLLLGSMYTDRLRSGVMSLTKVQPNTFKLQIIRTQEIDMGQYSCSVSAWSVNSQGDMVKIAEYKSSPMTVRWDPKRFYHSLRRLRDSLVLTKSGPAEFRFRLAGVQLSDRGFYWCDITAWTKQQAGQTWTRATSAESNKVRIDFQENGPSFSIAIQSDDTSVYPSKTAKMECSLSVSGSSPKTVTIVKLGLRCTSKNNRLASSRFRNFIDDLAYEVRWFFTRLRGGQTTTQVASVDRFGIVKAEIRNSSSELSVERRDTHTYLLNIFGTHDRIINELVVTGVVMLTSCANAEHIKFVQNLDRAFV